MNQNQKQKRQHSPQTFRNNQNPPNSTKQSDKSPHNQSLHTTLRYSALGTSQTINSAHAPGIVCPQTDLYHCQICSKLRLVCPLSKNKSVDVIYRQKIPNIKPNTQINRSHNIEHTKNITFNNRPQTPQFNSNVSHNGNFQNIGVKFIDSLPYIPRPLTSSRKSLSKGIQLSNKMEKKQYINKNIQPTPIMKINPRHVLNTTVHTQHAPLVYSHVTTASVPTRIIEQIHYVPYIHNVIVPQFINPQISTYRTPTSQKHSKYSNQAERRQKVPQPAESPITVRQYRENGLLTPQNFKKLAQSLRR